MAIVNWNAAESALEAARRFAASEGIGARVTIIDNDSLPEQRRLLESALPDGVDLVRSPANVGYGTAANQVLAETACDYVCVSNADVLPEKGMLAALAEAAATEPAGMVAPRTEGGASHYHAPVPGVPTLLVRAFFGSFNLRPARTPAAGEMLSVQQPSGACFLLRSDLWRELEGFDEEFFLWYEDVDLAKRLLDLGAKNVVVGSARATHHGGESIVRMPRREMQAIRLRSLRHYLSKHHERALPIARPVLAAAEMIRT